MYLDEDELEATMEPLTGVGGTALGVARIRARETRRPDRLFDDPYAADFAALAPSGPSPDPAQDGSPTSPDPAPGQ